jgi:hypothetical protein
MHAPSASESDAEQKPNPTPPTLDAPSTKVEEPDGGVVVVTEPPLEIAPAPAASESATPKEQLLRVVSGTEDGVALVYTPSISSNPFTRFCRKVFAVQNRCVMFSTSLFLHLISFCGL